MDAHPNMNGPLVVAMKVTMAIAVLFVALVPALVH